jgi:hypothetical protein
MPLISPITTSARITSKWTPASAQLLNAARPLTAEPAFSAQGGEHLGHGLTNRRVVVDHQSPNGPRHVEPVPSILEEHILAESEFRPT